MVIGQRKNIDPRFNRGLEVFQGAVESRIAGERPGRINRELQVGEAQIIPLEKGRNGGVNRGIIRCEVVGGMDHYVPDKTQLQALALSIEGGAEGEEKGKEEKDREISTRSFHLSCIVVPDPDSANENLKIFAGWLRGSTTARAV
jgi:hypothetical protein